MRRTILHHGRWVALALVLAFGLTACFKSAGENILPTPQDQVVSQPGGETPVFPPTFTPLVAATDTPQDLLPTAEEMTELPTGIPTLGPPTDTPAPLLFGGSPTPTLTVTTAPIFIQATNTPLSTPAPFVTNTPLPPPATNTPLPTTTPLPLPATFTPLPTLTPVPTQPPPVFLTATFTPVLATPLPPTPTYTPYFAPAAFNPNAAAFNPPLPPVQQQAAPFQAQPMQPQEAQPLGEYSTAPEVNGGQGGAAPTEPPVAIAQGPTLTVNEMTATAIVLEFQMTQAAAMGTFVPTPTVFGAPVIPTQPGGGPIIVVITSTPGGVPGQCKEHLVSPGETMYRIAAIYGVTVNQIAQMNGIVNPDLIEAGSTLRIPCPLPVTPTPIAPVVTPVPNPVSGTNTYIVEPGDNLYRISLRFNVSMAELMRVNGLTPATMNWIYAGQTLYIPAGAVVVTSTPIPGAGTDICSQPGVICVTATPSF